MKTLAVGLLGALLGVACLVAAENDSRVIEEKRVVVRVNVGGETNGYQYVHVDHDDGEPVVLESFVAERGYLGVSLLELTPELRQHFGADPKAGVMISEIDGEGPAFRAGLRAGDVLIAIDGRPLSSSAEFVEVVSAGNDGQTLTLDVVREGHQKSFEAALETRKRRQLDLGGLIVVPDRQVRRGSVDWHSRTAPRVVLDPEVMKRALGRMRRHFESREWREQLDRSSGTRVQLELRIRQLEQRLSELEKELEELDP